ncbi:MAG: NADH-quinone oxidoreductase subunit M [Acidobacteria bacterium]|nr:MAG: NADH-quinone oxidoreductase subunit M [Acidobacteriota bacterium]
MYFTGILSAITFIPLVGALIIMVFPKAQKRAIAYFATLVAGVDLLVSLPLFFATPENAAGLFSGWGAFNFVEDLEWIPAIGARYILGVDGISALMILLTTLLGLIAILSSWSCITDRVKEYYVFLLLLQTGMLGVFCSLDFFLFYVFWEVMLVPMYFLIGIWGGARRLYATIKFFLYTLAGSVLMLLGILAIYFYVGQNTFDVRILASILAADTSSAWSGIAWWVFLTFFIGFAIKVPMVPFHTWLPDAHTEAPTAASVILAGVLLKMGTYGFVRFSLPLMPATAWVYAEFLLWLSVIGIIYGALVAMAQKDWKKLIAYSSVSHLGFVMLGIFSFNQIGLSGGILQMVNHGLSTGALFLIIGIIYERRHTRLLSDFGGLSKVMPVFAVMFMIFTLSSIGMPALNGFIGEFTILAGAFQIVPALGGRIFAILGATGIILGAAYMLWLYQRTMFGKLDNPENENLKDLNIREWIYLMPLVLLCFWIGLYPKPFFAMLEPATAKLAATLENSRPAEFTWEGDALLRQADLAPVSPESADSDDTTPAEVLTAGGRP